MRVLFLSGYNHPSHHRKVDLLANQPDVEILHLVWPDSGLAEGWHPSANGARRYHVKTVPIRWLGQPGDSHRVIYRSALLEMTRFSPDIVHCEWEQESLLALQVVLARWMMHVNAPLILYSWQNILRQRRLAVRCISALTLHAAQHILCASQEAVQVLLRQGYRGGFTVSPMYGIDERYFAPEPISRLRVRLNLPGCIVGYIGRLIPEKGVEVLLHAAAKCESEISLLIVGAGQERASLENLAQDLGLSQRCQFVGPVPYDQVRDYLSALDILVLPSRTTPNWKEQYGRVLVEAMACRVVVVGANSGAIPEVINDAGRIFPENDAATLAQVLHNLAISPETRQALAERGQARAKTLYTTERIAETVWQVWQNVQTARG